MAVLVTGGAGYIGSHTVRLFRQRGRDVVVLDSLEYGHRAAVDGVPLVEADIADREAVRAVIEDFSVDAIVHFAAYKAAGESMEQPGRYFRNNVAGTNALVDAAADAGVERLVFSSTCAVYGTPATTPVGEDAPVDPESPYGESKALVERMLHWYDRCRGVRSVSLRYFNAAGAWPDGSIGEDWSAALNLVPRVMRALLRGERLRVFGTDYPTTDGTAVRDYIHVVDLADAHLRALELLEVGGATTAVNVGTGVGSSVLQVLAAAEAVAGRPVPHDVAPRRPGDPVAVYSDNRLAAELLGWQARHGLDDIVASAWAWHSTHPDGYGD
ncbi:MAG TPA: UDP-glucose 4-epimerase GalE [Acidimicrobiales bacterium]|nr:UDP-glucose 4-epimerase GalE [Acidimicrobiales bacterium]